MVVRMARNPVLLKVDGKCAVHTLQEAIEKLEGAEGEVILDFSAVGRMDPGALRAMEALANAADERSAKVVLRGVSFEIYKVLKLVDLAPRFAYLT